MNCTPPDHLPPSLLDLNWNSHSLQPTSPTGPNTQLPTDISYQYMPLALHSPPDLHLSMTDHHHHYQSDIRGLPMPGKLTPAPPHLVPLAADPGFVERAARLSCFGGRNYSSLTSQFALGDAFLGPLSCDAEQRNAESSASDPVSAAGEGNARKRKTAAPKGKGKDPKRGDGEDFCAKRSRLAEDANAEEGEIKPKTEQNCIDGDEGKKDNDKLTEPPKDYIHVRARRGQATDSHSLAERVRREKISERMKLLQDLVPGCNKVTGKALMLDEIINYVQSLQRQVEFLSMKLASVHPRLEFNMDSVLPKEMHQTSSGSPNSVYPLETSPSAFPYTQHPQQGNQNHLHCLVTNGLETQCAMNRLEPSLSRILGLQLPLVEGFGDAASQLGTLWQEDLQNVVQMNFGQSQDMHFPSQGFHGC